MLKATFSRSTPIPAKIFGSSLWSRSMMLGIQQGLF